MYKTPLFAITAAMILGLISWDAKEFIAEIEDSKAVVAEARAIVVSRHEPGGSSGSVLMARAGQPIYQDSVGLANRESATPNNHDTKYNLGSIIKNFTAVLVLQQVENGAIGMDDDLDSYDLGFPTETARKITVRNLLDHRSGLPDVFTSAYREVPLSFGTIPDKLALLQDAALFFEPGTEYHYSNFGYAVLWAILEKVTGQSFASLLQENIFDRQKLKDSVHPFRHESTNRSLRYTFDYAGEQAFIGVTERHGPDGGEGSVCPRYRTVCCSRPRTYMSPFSACFLWPPAEQEYSFGTRN